MSPLNYYLIMFHKPEQIGFVLQLPLASQVTVADPDIRYLSLHVYDTLPPNAVLVGVPGDPLGTVGGEPQSTTVCIHVIQF